MLILLLGVFAYALAHSQSQQRDDLEHRFEDRAIVAATVNNSLFSLATSSVLAADAKTFGSAVVNQQALVQRSKLQRNPYAAILSSDGKVLAKAGPVPADIADNPTVKRALASKQVVYSSLMPGPGGRVNLESAVAFPTQYGRRVDVSATDAAVLSQFLNSFLTKIPSVANAQSYVIDNSEKIVAAPGPKVQPGAPLPDKELAQAVQHGFKGSYDGNRYFASAPIKATPWRIVLSASKDDLYAPVKTTASWVIFIAFVLVALFGMILLWRVLISNAELQRADLSRRHALEINDNVVQRLVLAKYALDRGATETSQQKLAETLRETQQLVTSLLEERDITPGALRRDAPAETEGRPDPANRSVEGRE